MADPFTILGGVGAAAGIIVTITKTIRSLSDLHAKYADAEMSIRLLIRKLMAIKAALQAIEEWIGLSISGSLRERDLIEAFSTSLEGCKDAMEALCDEVTHLVQDALAGDRRLMRARYVWNEESMKDHQDRLDSQVQALQLLLSAVHCRTASEQTALLREPKNRQIVQKIRDDTSSLRATSTRGSHTQPQSILSRNSTVGGTEFEMDNDIVNTDVYRRVMAHQRVRSADERVRHAMGNKLPRSPDGISKVPSQDSGFDEAPESVNHLSPIDKRYGRTTANPRPYERSVASVASDPSDVSRHKSRPFGRNKSAPDSVLPSFKLTVGNQAVKKKRSFLPSLFTGSSSSLLSPNPQDMFVATSNLRRGRKHSDADIHHSIDLNSSDGRVAPPLVRAAQLGSGIEIEELLDQRVDIESRHERTRRTALAVASHCGNDDVVAILMQHGANPNTVDTTGMTPLHLAATRGHYRVVDYLLKENVKVDVVGPQKKTALRLAADNGHLEVANLLLNRRAKVNARDAQNITPLHSAAGFGDEDVVNLLLSYNADIEAKDGKFQSAIHHAAEKGQERIVDILLTRKADIEALGKDSMSPLMTACASGSTDVVRLLLQRKASLKHKGDGAMTALHWASYEGHSDVVELLLERRAPRDPQTYDGRTPLHLAVLTDNFATAELLLRKGASVEAACQDAMRPLHYVAQCTNTDLIQLLLGYNASIEAETKTGKRPLHCAAWQGNLEMVDILLRRGAAIDARDGAGDRPLCIASAGGNVEIVQLLLDRGAEMRTRYSTGPSHEDSPLCIAAKNGHLAVVEELVRRGASARQRDESNWQPLRYAAYYGHPAVVKHLLSCGASISTLGNPGSFGFNLTAERIGFAQGADIDEFRRQSVLMMLRDAEKREQELSASSRPQFSSNGAPQQEFPAEKADDDDSGNSGRYVHEPTTERQELPVHQKSPREWHKPYHSPYAESESESEAKNEQSEITPEENFTTSSSPARPRSPKYSEDSRFTLDPDSSSQPQRRHVIPPVPAVHVSHPDHFGYPFDPQSIGVTLSTPIELYPRILQAPARPPPHPPNPLVFRDAHTKSQNSSPKSPPPPMRSAPMPPDLPPIPNPNEAIVICEDCTVVGKNRTDLACAECCRALYMYHHIMYGEPIPVVLAASRVSDKKSPPPIYELE